MGSPQAGSSPGRAHERPTLWLFDIVLGALLALLLAAPVVALSGLPWNDSAPSWLLPLACAIGFGVGALGTVIPLSKRSTLAQLTAVPVLVGAAVASGALGAAVDGGLHLGSANALGLTLLAAYAGLLGATTLWLFFRVNQPWLAIVVAWITVAGVWRANIGLRQVWWVLILLSLSLLILGLRRLREETAIWLRDDLQRLGAVFWPSARAILAITLLVATVGLAPLAAQLGVLSQLWRQSPLGQHGPFPFDSPQGTPAAALGAPLGLNAPDVSGAQIVLTYELLAVPPAPPGVSGSSGFTATPPLLGATFDTFDGKSWTQRGQLTTIAVSGSQQTAPASERMEARITLRTLPRTDGSSFLLGFDQPIGFSIPAQARVAGGGAPNALNVANWQTSTPLLPGASYTTTSAVVSAETLAQPPSDATPQPGATAPAALDAAQAAQLEVVPPALQSQLHALAADWAANASTPRAQADAVLSGLRNYARLDNGASAPNESKAIQWFLQQRRGNVLMFTTTYILLCRSIGLPVRLAEGFLPGSYDTGLKQWVVRTSDAAIWAQLAIPGAGWLDLFPAGATVTLTTPSVVIQRADEPTPTPSVTTSKGANPTPYERRTQADQVNRIKTAVALGGSLLLVLVLALVALIAWRWSQLGADLGPLAQFFARTATLARLAGIPLRTSDTPKQATEKVVARIPQETETLLALNIAYERMRYGPPLMRSTLTNLKDQWKKLQGPLMRLVVSRPWRGPRGASSKRVDIRR